MSDINAEFTALILAATAGSRLYPLTKSDKDDIEDYFDNNNNNHDAEDVRNQVNSNNNTEGKDSNSAYLPKHLLPIAGKPIIHHLIDKLALANLNDIVVAISSQDEVTVSSLLEMGATRTLQESKNEDKNQKGKSIVHHLRLGKSQNLKVVQVPAECNGSADALRFVSSLKRHGSYNDEETIIPSSNHIIVMPGDLILYGRLCCGQGNEDTLGALVDEHRRNVHHAVVGKAPPLALTLVLADVGETDEHGAPLKESAKAKKGGVSREDGDIEYIALSEIIQTSHIKSVNTARRVVIKQSKYIVEEDEDNTGKTPKLNIPKARLHSPIHQMLIRTDWNDIHLICLSPWAIKVIQTKLHLKDLSKEVVPLFVESQFKGVKSCIGIQIDDINADDDKEETSKFEILGHVLNDSSFQQQSQQNEKSIRNEDLRKLTTDSKDYPFIVLAQTLTHQSSKLVLRSCNLQSYSYACREVVTHAIKSETTALLNLRNEDSNSFDVKSNSIVLTASLGEKVQIKSSTIGKNVQVGNRCRLNNVVVMDDVIIGENCILQNSVLSKGCQIGDNCSLNDCTLGPLCSVSKGTKAKGESFQKGDL